MRPFLTLSLLLILFSCGKKETDTNYSARVIGNYGSTSTTDQTSLKVEAVDPNTLKFTLVSPDGNGDFEKRIFDQIILSPDFSFVQTPHDRGMILIMANGDIYNFRSGGSGYFKESQIHFDFQADTHITYNGSR